jgi:hypothetical protein
MRETHALPVDLEDTCPHRFFDTVGLRRACSHQRKGWLSQSGDREEGSACTW